MGGGSRGKRPHTTFLGGFLSCRHCRKAMNGIGGKGNRMHRCRTRLTYGVEECPGVVVRAPRIDAAVEAMWLSHVTALDHGSGGLDVEKQARREDAMAALDSAKNRRDKLEHDFYVEGMLAEDRFKSLWADRSAAIDSLEIEAAELVREADLSIFFPDGEALAEAWAESTIEDRRMLLGCVMTSLTIIPARSGGTPMLDRLVPEWVA